jgi:transposase InsO family protein
MSSPAAARSLPGYRDAPDAGPPDVNAGPSGVRGEWLHHDLETRHKRLLRLERVSQESSFVLSDEEIQLLKRQSVDFCRRHAQASRPGELLLPMEGIEHRTSRARSPRTNGFVERMNRTPLDECFRVVGRTTRYLEPVEIQRDLDRFLQYYNLNRSHQRCRLNGRAPAQALREALGVEALPHFTLKELTLAGDVAASSNPRRAGCRVITKLAQTDLLKSAFARDNLNPLTGPQLS